MCTSPNFANFLLQPVRAQRVAVMDRCQGIQGDWWLDPRLQLALTMNVEDASTSVGLSKFR